MKKNDMKKWMTAKWKDLFIRKVNWKQCKYRRDDKIRGINYCDDYKDSIKCIRRECEEEWEEERIDRNV